MSEQSNPLPPSRLSGVFTKPPSAADVVVVRIILVLIMIAAAAALVFALWPSQSINYTTAAASAAAAPVPDGTAANVTVAHTDELVWTISDPNLAQRLLVALPTLLGAALVGIGAWLLFGITTRIHRGHAFARPTITRLRALALVVLFGGLVLPFIELTTKFALSAQVQSEPHLLLTFDLIVFWPVIVGLLLLLLTEVFVKGRVLSDDLEGLV